MTRILNKPCSETERIDFICEANNEGLLIFETDEYLRIIEVDEMLVEGQVIKNPDYEAQKAQKERERLDMLSLTKREVFLALYKDKGITPDVLKSQITDPAALIEFEYANDYYRGNPLITLIGKQLGYTSDELDYLFEYGEFEVKPVEKDTTKSEG